MSGYGRVRGCTLYICVAEVKANILVNKFRVYFPMWVLKKNEQFASNAFQGNRYVHWESYIFMEGTRLGIPTYITGSFCIKNN